MGPGNWLFAGLETQALVNRSGYSGRDASIRDLPLAGDGSMIRQSYPHEQTASMSSLLSHAANRLHDEGDASLPQVLGEALTTYMKERPEIVVVCCFALGFFLGRRLSLS